ncbi:selenide, water dikinase SelD [Ancylobacter sp. 6x-1]|uniref:Selenide, water dikinase n=1 Tax=Ancylobacter crimeensis TaxID=2579147 RepID=A0ABT0DB46_9HYPH|nr:selenide, water dikinase SelD [Ancylobacter crimeensis]MCK0197187.1 selenide, water dikinase SelD [Ancylobacter crimeensis]
MLDTPTATPPLRLTSLAHGGGCGCKLAPAVLRDLLSDQPAAGPFANLLVGTETGDDAAVWALDDETCIIATTDFFMPMVDDPFTFGRIAATNAISDVYAMGGRPILALAILGMPLGKIPIEMVREILKGGASVAGEAGIPVAGGHSIDSPEPIYGLAVIGTAKRSAIRRNADARPGDALILTKPLGVGIYSAAFKKEALSPPAYAEMVASMTLLNRIGTVLGGDPAVHAITDVTGFGILGHGLEMARGSELTIEIERDRLPLLAHAGELAEAGYVTGASHRNWASYGEGVVLPEGLPDAARHVLTDPQTSGGLLVACAPEAASGLVARMIAEGYPAAAIIGRAAAGEPVLRVL